MKPRRLGLALLLGGGGSFLGGSYLASRALAKRLISSEGLGPTTARREDLLDALRAAGATVADYRHRGSARSPVELAAIFASPGKAPAGATILFLHGKGGDPAEWQPDALRALADDYNVLLPNLRGHAPSGGTFVTYGFLEKDDLANAVAAASERFGLDSDRLGIHSCSAGSTIALEFAAEKPSVRALWLESPYAEPLPMARQYLAAATGLPAWTLALTTRWAVRHAVATIKRGLDIEGPGGLEQVDPVRAIARLRGPVCLVYGETDRLIPPHFVRRLEGALPPGSIVWRARGAGHCHHEDEAERVAADEYGRRWTRFFASNLRPDEKEATADRPPAFAGPPSSP